MIFSFAKLKRSAFSCLLVAHSSKLRSLEIIRYWLIFLVLFQYQGLSQNSKRLLEKEAKKREQGKECGEMETEFREKSTEVRKKL